MRRQDREVTDPGELAAILASSNICRLAMNGDGYPYIVPLSYGFTHEGGRFALYFHCAHEGTKLDLLRADPRAAFEVEGKALLRGGKDACSFTIAYESVVGQGEVVFLTDREEKRRAMEILMENHAPGRDFAFPDAALDATEVFRVDVAHITGKRNPARA